ncbi:tetratricopeptide repeat protein [Desulfobotulus mexicanus]|uniref:Tetratricopeptide repeat protein n=1 Tax=Desulfobotulus mexicanus TaxID=2586642 RepID=A0A5Q4VC74_9BACT|nr:tetratricopeptide repeat protein [Desulfobotulus mexicanus]TYT75304.1 hypothetical protein FIM25_06265 [Desulfobotulus mexicanus]
MKRRKRIAIPASKGFIRHLEEAQRLHVKGNYEKALQSYHKLLRLRPDHAVVLGNIGAIYLAREQFDQAYRYISKALEAAPDFKDALNNLLLIHLHYKDYGKAEQVGEYLVSLDASNPLYVIRLYMAYMSRDARRPMFELLQSYYNACLEKNEEMTPQLESYFFDLLFEFEEYEKLEEILLAKDENQANSANPDINIYLRLSRLYREQINFQKSQAWLDLIPENLRDGFGYHTEILKTYGKAGEDQTAIPSGQWLLEFKDRSGHESADLNWVQEVTAGWGDRTLPEFNSDKPERNIIAFSLFGDNEKYTLAAVANAQLARRIYPGWTARFYCGSSVPDEILDALRKEGAQVKLMDESRGRYTGLFWRFYAANDPDVDYFICRDCDALLNDKEYLAVQEWLDSGKPFHLMRDHVQHAEIMLAGLWGGVSGWLPDLEKLVEDYYRPGMSRWADQQFQQRYIWPLIKPYTLTHDTFYDVGYDTRPFPEGHTLPKEWHVGGYVPLKVARNFKATKKREHIKKIQDFCFCSNSDSVMEMEPGADIENVTQAMNYLRTEATGLKLGKLQLLVENLRHRFDNSELLNMMGVIMMRRALPENALSLFEQAVLKKPDEPKYIFNSCLAAIKLSRYQAASSYIELFSEKFDLYDDLQKLKTKLKKIDKNKSFQSIYEVI